MSRHRRRVQFSTKIVTASVCAVVLYTGAMVALAVYNIQSHSNVWPPAELTALWFAFWTAELVMLASIKKEKIRNKYEKEEDND